MIKNEFVFLSFEGAGTGERVNADLIAFSIYKIKQFHKETRLQRICVYCEDDSSIFQVMVNLRDTVFGNP